MSEALCVTAVLIMVLTNATIGEEALLNESISRFVSSSSSESLDLFITSNSSLEKLSASKATP